MLMDAIERKSAPKAGTSADLWLLGAMLFLVWGGMIAKLTTDWSTNPQYEFGYFVPFFVLYLLARRWEDRPEPSPDAGAGGYLFVAGLLLLLLLPIRVVQEANPDWRPLNWVHAVLVVVISVALFGRVGGTAWMAHFVLPLCLMFFCLPWPLGMEQSMIQDLTGAVTRSTVELLNWINVPALQRGNVIEVVTGSVGVADACSGMRSLAGTLMAGFFFGEYYRLNWLRRLILIGVGSALAFAFNIARTFFLGWRTAAEGPQAVDHWHDPAGYLIFVVSFACLWILARLICEESSGGPAPTGPRRGTLLPIPILVICILWLVGIHAATEAWYRFREGKRTPARTWSISLPEHENLVRATELPSEVRSILRYSEASSASVNWPDGRGWSVIVLQWDAGRSSAQLATMHRPEICMPAAGYRFVGPTEPIDFAAQGIKLTFDGSIFDSGGQGIYVYRCLWEDQIGLGTAWERRFDMSIQGRLMSSWYGRRNLGQKLIQIGITGVSSESEARQDLLRRLPALLAVPS